jgi:hypothetical protein
MFVPKPALFTLIANNACSSAASGNIIATHVVANAKIHSTRLARAYVCLPHHASAAHPSNFEGFIRLVTVKAELRSIKTHGNND